MTKKTWGERFAGLAGYKRVHIREHESGLRWREGDWAGLLGAGTHWLFDPENRVRVDVLDRRAPFLVHAELDVVAASGALAGVAEVANVLAHQRVVVWVDGRPARILGPGLHAWWTAPRAVRHEVFDLRDADGRFVHAALAEILDLADAKERVEAFTVTEETAVARFADGAFAEILGPGRYAWWKGGAAPRFAAIDLREQTVDVAGQELLTADKVGVRVNAVLSYRVVDAKVFTLAAADTKQALYREAQLALRAEVDARETDALLADRDALAGAVARALESKVAAYGARVTSFGVRDIILPGEMKALLARVTEAKKTAEAALVQRREETAAMRHQLNTARLLADNPTLMKLREWEVLTQVAATSRLRVRLDGKRTLGEAVGDMV